MESQPAASTYQRVSHHVDRLRFTLATTRKSAKRRMAFGRETPSPLYIRENGWLRETPPADTPPPLRNTLNGRDVFFFHS